MFGKELIFSGGGYFRLLPYPIIKNCSNQTDYIMSYFHPRDFDHGQPMIADLSAIRRFKSYVGLKQSKPKLGRWLSDFEFIDLAQAIETIDWNKVPKVRLKQN